MKNKGTIAILVVVIVIIAWLAYQYNKIMNYDFNFRWVKFDLFGSKQIKGKFYIDFINKSGMNLTYTDCKLDMYLNNTKLINLTATGQTILAANSTTPIEFNFDVIPTQVFSISNIATLDQILTQKETVISFYGTITIKLGFLRITVPVNVTHPLSYYLNS